MIMEAGRCDHCNRVRHAENEIFGLFLTAQFAPEKTVQIFEASVEQRWFLDDIRSWQHKNEILSHLHKYSDSTLGFRQLAINTKEVAVGEVEYEEIDFWNVIGHVTRAS